MDLRMTAISGRGNSLFAIRMGNIWNQGSPTLGQGEDLYARAKAALARWNSLVERLKRIANRQVREDLARKYGINEPSNKDKGQYAANVVAYDISEAEKYVPVNYRIYVGPGPAKNRPGRLEDWNHDLNDDVQEAERLYGSLPEPQVITQTITERISELPGWVVPVGIGVAAVGLLGAFGVIKI